MDASVRSPMSTNHEVHLERREYKYLLPMHLVPKVRAAARAVCRLDRYAGPTGVYTIRSLYFDTDRLDLFWANHHERADRFKLRVRTYPGSNGPVFLEVKRRVQDVIVKTRGAVSGDVWVDIVRDPARLQELSLPPHTRAAVERFLSLVHTYHLEPTLLVQYEREAYASEVDEYARLTFDFRVACQQKRTLDLEADPERWHPTDHTYQTRTLEPVVVLELKFQASPPRWMVDLVRRLELQRLSFSKYGYGVAQQWTSPGFRQAAQHTRGDG